MLFYATYNMSSMTAIGVYRTNVNGTDVRQIAALDSKGWPPVSVNQRNTICWANNGGCRLNMITLKSAHKKSYRVIDMLH